jgi:hypothetical protein
VYRRLEIRDNRLVKTLLNPETTVKITSKDKEFLEQIIECLQTAFDCELTSPKMYNDEKDIFFQYIAISKREA